MAYNNNGWGFPASYNNYGGYNNPYMQQYQQPQQMQPPQPQTNSSGGSIQWVQGESGAKAFTAPVGQPVLLMDSENNTFYIKSTDASGMPLPLRIFDYTERTANSTTHKAAATPQIDTSMFVTKAELEERLAAFVQPTPAPQRKPTNKKAEGDT